MSRTNASLDKYSKNSSERQLADRKRLRVSLTVKETGSTERNENGTIEKKEQEQKDLAEGHRSRTERNDLKKWNVPSPS